MHLETFHRLMCLPAQSCPTLCNPMDCSLLFSAVCGVSLARILEWAAISFSRGPFQLRNWTCVSCGSCTGRQILCDLGHPGSHKIHSLIYISLVVVVREGNGTPLQYSCLENPMDGGAWWAAVHGVAKSQTWLSDFPFTFHFHALEKEMATHSSVLAWRIPGMGEPGGLPSMGPHRVRHDWSDLAASAVAAVVVVRSLPSLNPGFILLYSF